MFVPPARNVSHTQNDVLYLFSSRVVDVDSLISRVSRALPFLTGSAHTHVITGASYEKIHVSIVGSLASPAEENPYERSVRLQSLASSKPHPNILLSNKYLKGINHSLECRDTVRLLDDLDVYEDFLNETDDERACQKNLFENTSLNMANTKPTPLDCALSDIKAKVLEFRDNSLPDIFDSHIFNEATSEINKCLAAIKAKESLELIQSISLKIDHLFEQYTAEKGKRKAASSMGPQGKKLKAESESESEEVLPESKIKFHREVYIDDLLKLCTALVIAKEQVPIPCHDELAFLANCIETEEHSNFDEVLERIKEVFSQKIDLDVKLIKVNLRVRRIMKSANLSFRLVHPEKKIIVEDKVSELNTLFKFIHSNCYTLQISLKTHL